MVTFIDLILKSFCALVLGIAIVLMALLIFPSLNKSDYSPMVLGFLTGCVLQPFFRYAVDEYRKRGKQE